MCWLILILMLMPVAAVAQPTLTIWVDADGTLVNQFDVVLGEVFEIVVLVDTDGHEIDGVAWTMRDLTEFGFIVSNEHPLSFWSCALDGCHYWDGFFQFPFDECQPASGRLEVVRFGMLVIEPVQDFVLQIEEPIDWSSWGTTPVMGGCGDPWRYPMVLGGSQGGTTASGVTWPAGGLILSPTRPTIDVATRGLSALKARY